MSSLSDHVDEIGKNRWVWRLLAALFFLPILINIFIGPEKKFKAARDTGDIKAAQEAVGSMRIAGLVSIPIGAVILAARINGM